jgi:uncharacterized protein with ParB-like and HNH nuclease domain
MAKESYFEANTFGIGQLITQRKMLVVPEHQRDFSWSVSEVDLFFNDIANSMLNSDSDYFVGLIVLMGPREGNWIILDGQQRLATTTMIYSAIRNWLASRNYDDDADQIDSEMIAVRTLGGTISARMRPNLANREVYDRIVVRKYPDADLKQELEATSRFSSNRLLMEATLSCRELISEFVARVEDPDKQRKQLYELANYIETNVRVVALDVSSEANAYVIFESLNARGNELAVLDLVKNYIFGKTTGEHLDDVRNSWQTMADALENKDTDDYLKTFWTARFGRVQKPKLYEKIKSEYRTAAQCESLAKDLCTDADAYLALDTHLHNIWNDYGDSCKSLIYRLIQLGSKQYRAPVFAALTRVDPAQMEALLWALIVLTVRYQIVGRRRTGLLEIFCAKLANQVYSQEIKTTQDIYRSVRSLLPSDDDFRTDFMRFSESKKQRQICLLLQMEDTERTITHPRQGGVKDWDMTKYDVTSLYTREMIGSKVDRKGDGASLSEWFFRLGNKMLLRKRAQDESEGPTVTVKRKQADLLISKGVDLSTPFTFEAVQERQKYYAELAIKTWFLP